MTLKEFSTLMELLKKFQLEIDSAERVGEIGVYLETYTEIGSKINGSITDLINRTYEYRAKHDNISEKIK